MKCKACGHPDWCHHAVSGKCECVTFQDVKKTEHGYSYNTQACGCIVKPY